MEKETPRKFPPAVYTADEADVAEHYHLPSDKPEQEGGAKEESKEEDAAEQTPATENGADITDKKTN